MKRKRSKKMAEWLRWLRLKGACNEGVAFVRRYSSPQKAWEALGKRGKCKWMAWLMYKSGKPFCIHQGKGGFCEDRFLFLGQQCLSCAASILRRYPKVPDWRGR